MASDIDIIDDMAATLLDIINLANSGEVETRGDIARAADEAIMRWKADMPWPRLNNPMPPPKPVLTEEGERAYRQQHQAVPR